MRVIIDIECNSLHNPTNIWVIVCKDIDTNGLTIFRNVTQDKSEADRFRNFIVRCTLVVGHNLLGYDLPVLGSLLACQYPTEQVVDTLIVSKLVDYPRQGHSLEAYGEEFGIDKDNYSDFTKYSQELEDRCIRDVEINHRVYLKYLKYISKEEHKASLSLEQRFQLIVNKLTDNGFSFGTLKGKRLLLKVEGELQVIDKDIRDTFVPKLKVIRTVIPKETKYGTISLSSIPKVLRGSMSEFTAGAPFSYCHWVDFNPSSHKQLVNLLNEAGWRPVDKTQSHIETERELGRLKYKQRNSELDITIKELHTKLEQLRKTGWKVNETNLDTLPASAPPSTRLLAKRILLESRRRTLTEWLGLVQSDDRIHGKFYAMGAWTHRMAHQSPNTANIPNEFDNDGKRKLYGKELRALWQAPKNRLLVGVDAEGIQLRIFAHLIDDPEFTDSLVRGRKDDKTDPHSLNQRILGDVCKGRQVAKRYIYALLLGAGKGKLQEILGCDEAAAAEAYERLLRRYTGFALLKDTIIPADAKRGWFTGLDGRRVRIPGETVGSRKHLAMSGYLQNGEAVIMKSATLLWHDRLEDYDSMLVNLVHDEWQSEVPNNMEVALRVASLQADSLRIVGEQLNLRCPLAGSYWNDDLKDYTIATNWSKTH